MNKKTNTGKINTAKFSIRELDILACLLRDMPTKEIAAFLLLSNSTVETHVGNLIAKLSCNSRGDIVELVKKQNYFDLIKKHHFNLFLNLALEQELKNLVQYEHKVKCVIAYYQTDNSKNSFASKLGKYLTIAGIDTIYKPYNKTNFISNIVNASEDNLPDHIIYVFCDNPPMQPDDILSVLSKETSEIKTLQKNIELVIIFHSTGKFPVNINYNLPGCKFIYFTEEKKYYLLVFKLLKMFFPNNDFSKIIAKLNKQSVTLNNLFIQNNKLIANRENKRFSSIKTKLFSIGIIFLLIVIIKIIIFAMFSFKPNLTLIDKYPLFIKKIIVTIQQKFVTIKETYYGKTQYPFNENVVPMFLDNTKKETLETLLVNIPPRNISFTGRESALKYIHSQLNRHKLGIITQAIAGLGGVGKTQLATEFTYKAMENHFYQAAVWLTAETATTISNSYGILANNLKLDVRGLKPNEVQNLVHQKLEDLYKNAKILFVLDNVPNYEEVQTLIEKIHKQLSAICHVNILITSRSQHWPQSPLILDVFTAKEAYYFIKKELTNEEDEAIIRLAKTLHYFPLALNQATSYIKTHTNIDEYLQLYASKT